MRITTYLKTVLLSAALTLSGLSSGFAATEGALIEWRSIHQPIVSNAGMVSSQEHHASMIGAQILAQGGNAVDAAVAIGFAEAVTLPKAGNLGGGGFMLVHLAKEDKTIAIDYREMAPSAAGRNMYLDENGEVVRNLSMFTPLASGVPGTTAGLLEALEKYGTMTRQQVMMPAYKLAKEGFALDNPFIDSLAARAKRLQKDPEVKRIFYREDGSNHSVGDKVVFNDLAVTLKRIMDKGRDGFYKGPVAEALVTFMEQNGGLISHADLAGYKVKHRKVVSGEYRGLKVVSMPPPSSGGVHVIQMLNMLENYNIGEMGWGSADHIHTLVEVMRRAYADRSKHLGDPDFHPVPVSQIIDKDYAKRLTRSIRADRATPSEEVLPANFDDRESNQTTHFSVVDKDGNVVSNTYTLNFSFGSGRIAPGTGFFLNNEMDDFSSKPGVPNAYGLLGGEANAIESGKRPLSSMTPTLVFDDKGPILITGSPGGGTIINTVVHQIVNLVDFGMNVADAAAAPRFHHQWFPDTIRIEAGFSPDTLSILRQRGHSIRSTYAFGSVQSISVSNGRVFGSSDPRRSGAKTIGVTAEGVLVEY